MRLRYSTTLAEREAGIQMVFEDDYFTILITSDDSFDKMGCNILLQNGAWWYGGNITSAQIWPANSASFEVDPFYANSNQTSPIWFSSKGLGVFVDTYKTMGYSFNKDTDNNLSFHVKNANKIKLFLTIGNSITESYKTMIGIVGKPQTVPVKEYFTRSIFNSWIQFKKDVNQSGLIEYADNIRKYEIPCSILEIDDMWTPAYGEFDFDKEKFPSPKEMVEKLDSADFKVVLWVTPFVEKKASVYKYLRSKGYLILNSKDNSPYMTQWWNGKAALIDFSNPEAYEWFLNQLKSLQQNYGVRGFKLDAGDAEYLNAPFKSFADITPSQYTDLFASIGKYFEINELRVSWLTQSLGLVQRLRDKDSDWSSDKGIGSLIPHGMTEGLIGYPYFCPDMIGGGEMGSFEENNDNIDSELFIRWAQASTFMPMMQFSFAPWRVDSLALSICRKYTRIHEKLGDYIYNLAENAKETGYPIVTPLFFYHPLDSISYTISDQFMLGDKFLVAPVLKKGKVSRDIYLPQGTWVDFWNGDILKGGQTIVDYPAPIDKLPVFINIIN